MPRIVGRVVELARFPVKSMAGERPIAVEVDWQGIEGDRQFAFYRTGDPGRFPWLSGRDVPELLLHRARFRDPKNPRRSPVEVTTPDGAVLPLADPRLLAGLAARGGVPLALLQLGRGTFDSMPLSVVSTATHAALDAAHGRVLDRARFRTNILIESAAPEAEWRGCRLGFGAGAAELLVADTIPRCAIITVDPESGARDPAAMRTVAQVFGNRIGVYAAPAKPGGIRVGDPVFLLE